jgi:hypothetical protein
MRYSYKLIYLFLFAIIFITSCKKPYIPPVILAPDTYLVVEGLINSGGDSTIIKLSRTVPISNNSTDYPVLQALVTVESDQSTVYTLKEAGNGKYVSSALLIDKSRQYRLRIKTADNKEYLSDFVPVHTNPPIDSLGYKITNEGLLIYASTHDPTNNVQYYRWDYDEEWEFHAAQYSEYIVKTHISNGKMVSNFSDIKLRDATNDVYYCFTGDVSSGIVLGTDVNLKQAIIYQSPIVTIPTTSEKIEMEYSILVRQYALTSKGFDFYARIKKDTEQLGSIFDGLPSEIPGNIHSTTNPSEPVIGFISANNVQSKRIFVHKTQLPATWLAQYPYNCNPPILTVGNAIGIFLLNIPHLNLLLDTAGKFYRNTYECADCTIRGSTAPPPYWKY